MNNKKEIRGKHLSTLLKIFGLKQIDISNKKKEDSPLFPSEINEICKGKRLLSEEKAEYLKREFFPNVRIEYLLGLDNYMTVKELQISEYFNNRDSVFDSYLNIFQYCFSIIRERKRKGNRIEYKIQRVYDKSVFGDNYHFSNEYELSEEYLGVAWWEIQNAKTGKTIMKFPAQDMRKLLDKIQNYIIFELSDYIENNKNTGA